VFVGSLWMRLPPVRVLLFDTRHDRKTGARDAHSIAHRRTPPPMIGSGIVSPPPGTGG